MSGRGLFAQRRSGELRTGRENRTGGKRRNLLDIQFVNYLFLMVDPGFWDFARLRVDTQVVNVARGSNRHTLKVAANCLRGWRGPRRGA
jgi:hypothetical protein